MSQAAPPFVGTYRLQLRGGVDLDAARALLPWLGSLGVSHLYLAPPFHAASGSTHGYDVIDPTQIDPVLGGQPAFDALSDAAQLAGIGIVIDIVPNHMAFTPENPWLADVLRHGAESPNAPIFDIDWDAGALHFPVLDGTIADLLAAGQITPSGTADDPHLRVYEREYPLRPTDLSRHICGGSRTLDASCLDALLAEQHWSLGDWQDSADRITHRRFFNITDLIGVRQEDPAVFALTHRWIIEQVAAGRIQGLRVDHVDGLARPGAYLQRLREAVGDTPIWVEKIVKDGEAIPSFWPIEGMSGYEFMAPLSRLLAHPAGLAAVRDASHGAVPENYALEVRRVRRELLDQVFTPELSRVTRAALAALALEEESRAQTSEAIARLATVWPVYRSYAADLCPLCATVSQAIAEVGDTPMAAALGDLLRAPDDPPARAFAARFEQLTGALTAKSEEDTVFFRQVSFLPFCEVGAAPDLGSVEASAFAATMADRARVTPLALNALSTHDTKRSADARAVLIALGYFPDLAGALYAEARQRANAAALPERWGLYALQTALIMRNEPDATDRITAHIAKAMREGKELSRHEAPDEAAEAQVARLCLALHRDVTVGDLLPASLRGEIDTTIEAIVLAQAALQMTAPGIPDIYQGSEALAIALTDPDNRRKVDWAALQTGQFAPLSMRKLDLTRALLARRQERPDLFTHGDYVLQANENSWLVERHWQGQNFTLRIPIPRQRSPQNLQPLANAR
ncbi:malto-oligosyltrehalose synthase [Novosphingobium guangzhouense]|uniref:Malto-oligosyltrehalose synthase n=1 Tax=Novosphingobium guangzhouense TaxID=1850347 RepID=A0A2K2FXL0_9SPHN|nr:malto-oligosyltrehalose synthase [Novosphingobium guangzhouense]PNU03494.1 malto-oligosyltrehalose synthase [Novosphingobium guangzhouense]